MVYILNHSGSLPVNTKMVHNWFMDKVSENPQMKIRLSPMLKALVEEAAKANNRTMNAEIVSRLEHTFGESKSGLSEKINDLHEKPEYVTREEVERMIREALGK